MRHLNALVLAGTFATTTSATASLPRGVSPDFAQHFSSLESFKCISNPSIILQSSQINDGSCDCPDGSDEPGTAACAHLGSLSPPQPLAGSPSGSTNTTNALPGFWCPNVGHIGMYVPFTYVNDGVCDYDICCDGSEEYAGVGGIQCENRCDTIGTEYRRIEKAKKESLERATKRRRTMVKESKELQRQVEVRIGKHKAELEQLEQKQSDLKSKYEQVKEMEAGRTAPTEAIGGKLGELLKQSKSRVQDLRKALGGVVKERDALQKKVDELEAILAKFKDEYNPNFNDEGVKAAVHGWEDYAAKLGDEEETPEVEAQEVENALVEDGIWSGINWRSFEESDEPDSDMISILEAYLPSFLKPVIHDQLISLRIWLIENGILADNPTPSGESALELAAREAYEAAGRDITNKQKEIDNETKDLDKDYGPDGIFRSLGNKCVSIDSGEYEYELCWMGKAMQKSKKGHGNTNMGNFKGIEVHDSDEEERADGKGLGTGPRLVLVYEGGQGCWNGPQRSTDVWLGCHETEELWRVSESEKCVYRMEVGTPAACGGVEHPVVEMGPEEKHDEL